jgi:hypothetical protein
MKGQRSFRRASLLIGSAAIALAISMVVPGPGHAAPDATASDKEFVSAKVSGDTASLTNPALDRILDFAAEAGLVGFSVNDFRLQFSFKYNFSYKVGG